ncbi:thiolase family protein [Longirhabdus pacifica]|uniref:thiolase family protein n=1 Tax=Longirhabdus pacifica TaxID=2305227 RepID=UPI0010089357|nr:thiolase family protein [Longirhabdus pacifica]
MTEVIIASAVRTAVGKKNGVFRKVHPIDLAAAVLKEVVHRAGMEAAAVEDVVMGCVSPLKEQGMNIARLSLLRAGYPVTVPGVQINRMCGSGQQAIHFASQEIASGDMDVTIGGGVEHMTCVPIGSDGDTSTITPELHAQYTFVHQGVSAELVAEKYGVTKAEMDRYALQSHERAVAAIQAGCFADEIVGVKGLDKAGNEIIVTQDEGPRADTTLDKIASLQPAFREDGTITAGNASQVSDGAAAVLLMNKEKADQLGVKARGRIVAQTVVGSDPTIMLDGVIPATHKVLNKANLTIKDMDRIEINEAFAPVVLAWKKETDADLEKVNVNGGAIALGHPLGATGAKLLTSLLYELERIQGRYGLLTVCIGHGMSTAMIIERI